MKRGDHYAALDGLRGFAAIAVLLFHLGHWLGIPRLATNARLAVDLFFCLSGYVVPLAYQRRIEHGMTLSWFMWLRGVRLWPMILAGTTISAAYLLMRRFGLHDLAIEPVPLGLTTLLSVLCLPDFVAPAALGGAQVFPLNGPQYTLFFELVVNLAWGLSPRLRGPRTAAMIVALSFGLVAIFGPGGDQQATFLRGFARVFGSYYTGVLIFHALRNPETPFSRLALRLSGTGPCMVWLCLTTWLFYWPQPLPGIANWLWSLLVAPLLVLGGTHIAITGTVQRLALWLGELSYPLYALHYPLFVWLNGIFQKVTGHKAPVVEAILIAPLAILGSVVVLHLFDRPIRSALRARRAAIPASRAPLPEPGA